MATQTAPSPTPRGMISGRGRRSESQPKRGCTTDDETVCAKTSPPAAA